MNILRQFRLRWIELRKGWGSLLAREHKRKNIYSADLKNDSFYKRAKELEDL